MKIPKYRSRILVECAPTRFSRRERRSFHDGSGFLFHDGSVVILLFKQACNSRSFHDGSVVILLFKQACNIWTKKGIQNHINIKELLAIEQAVRRAPPEQRLLIYTDSTVALAYARRLTGRIASLHAIAARIFQQLRAKRTTLEVRHIPGLENTEADTLSRQSTQHEWCVTRASFRQATTILGVKPTTDLFSSNVAFQKDCGKRFSRFQNDAFALPDWSTRTLGPQPLWIAPPVRLIAEVLARLRATEDRATSVVVVPLWRGTKWWPLLVS